MAKKISYSHSKKNDYTFKKVAENLYRLNEAGGNYALVKRGGKQIRRSLKTKDRYNATCWGWPGAALKVH